MKIFQKDDAPRYKKGFIAHFCLYVLFNIILIILRLILTRRNIVKRQQGVSDIADPSSEGKSGSDEHIDHSNAFADLTDKENPNFRYDF